MTTLSLTTRDEQIVQIIADYRFMTAELLFALTRTEPSPEKALGADGKTRPRRYGFGMSGLDRRLRRLTQENYLTRFQVNDIPGSLIGVSRPFIYGLGPKAIDLLAPDDAEVRHELRAGIRANRDGRSLTLRHDLLRSTFHTCLVLGAKRLGLGIAWTQDRIKGLEHDGKHQYPDAFFSLTKDGRNRSFVLEVDMSTANIDPSVQKRTTIRNKMEAYLENKTEDFQLLWLTRPRNLPEGYRGVIREDAMMELYRSLAPNHNDFMLWLNGRDIPLDKPETLITENLFSCAYETDHGHALFPHLIN